LDCLSDAQMQKVRHRECYMPGLKAESLLRLLSLSSLKRWHILPNSLFNFPRGLQFIDFLGDVSGDQFQQCVNTHCAL
jgi:hypothetical protein